MATTLLIKVDQTPEQLNDVLNQHQDIHYIFFYAEGVNALNQKNWKQDKTFNICRTALLRRNLIKEETTLNKPWVLSSLYDFYQNLAKSKTLLILDKKGLSSKEIKSAEKPKLLFILENLKEITHSEELIEFIIGASLSFEVHVCLKDEIITHPWDKHLSALPHYDIQMDEPCDEKNFDLVINCY